MPSPPPLQPSSESEGAGTADARVGTVLADRYRIDSLLGEGGMGRVYAAEHVLMRKRLAVKVLHRELTTVPEVVQRFEREAMAAANIEHPNVAAATDFGKLPDGAVFLVLEYVQGKNLRDEIAQGPIGVERALHIARQIASALASAHALDIVHRDLKPENVMLVDKSGDPDFVKVLDFGIAKVPIADVPGSATRTHTPITKVGMVFGTPEYMAPEQALGQPVDGRADLYGLGVILYEMLSCERPFSSKSPVGILGQQLSNPPPPIAERAPGVIVAPQVEQLVQRLLAKDVSERFQNATQVVEAIDALLGTPVTRGTRRFTQLSGSPNSARGSSPRISRPDHTVRIEAMPASGPGATALISGASTAEPKRASDPIGQGQPSFSDGFLSGGEWPAGSSPDGHDWSVDELVEAPPRTTRSWPPPVERALRWVDARRDRLPAPLHKALRDVPALGLLVIGGVLALGATLGVLAVIVTLVRDDDSVESVTTAASAAPSALTVPVVPSAAPSNIQSELESARKEGVAGLERLAERHPQHAEVWLELVQLHDQAGDHSKAVSSIGRALAADSKISARPQVATALFRAAQAKESSDATFALLQGPMGSRGADIVYDLVTTKGVRAPVKQRASEWLHTPEFDRLSSAPLNIAVALRHAQSCTQKYALLLRAKNVGDARSLPYLKTLETRTGCGRRKRDDCYPCLRKDDRLKQAIKAVESRDKAG